MPVCKRSLTERMADLLFPGIIIVVIARRYYTLARRLFLGRLYDIRLSNEDPLRGTGN